MIILYLKNSKLLKLVEIILNIINYKKKYKFDSSYILYYFFNFKKKFLKIIFFK